MTTSLPMSKPDPSIDPVSRPRRHVQLALRINAAFSAITGTVALLGAARLNETFGLDVAWLFRVVGGGLVGFAIIVMFVATKSDQALVVETLMISVADLGWVAGTAVVLLVGIVDRSGGWILAGCAAVVLDLAIAQLWTRRRYMQSLS